MQIAIVDDMPEDRTLLSRLLTEGFQKYNVSVHISHYDSAEAFLESLEPELFDLCFMDIYMDGINGMEAARRLHSIDPDCRIVFLTSSDEYVYEGYEINALRYLLKPPAEDKLQKLLEQCAQKTELNRRRLPITIGKQTTEIPYGKILYVTSVHNSIELHFEDTYLSLSARHTFSQTVEPLLSDFRFLSCGRGVVVNLSHAKKLLKDSFLMQNGDRIPISRRMYPAVSSAYMDFQFEHMI
ncbi:MAG: response regulator transcription factor [Clostridiales bacterium]|nr:response regulator transcription factor [Clostridiales bacterium]